MSVGVVVLWMVKFGCVVLCVPFFTLLERKILSYIQLRKGPKKTGMMGLLQPMSDGGKLFLKELSVPFGSKKFFFNFSPCLFFFILVCSWFFFSFSKEWWSIYVSVLLFLCFSSLQVYVLLFSGWGSKSKYALMGGVRGATQVISYEVGMIMLLLFPCCCFCSYKFLVFYKKSMLIILVLVLVSMMWLLSMLAETNRSPFDFAEGESELVSGFNVEYGSMGFAFLFIAEYGSIILMSFLTSLIFFSTKIFMMVMIGKIFCFWFIWVRASLPRFRIDFLMNLSWKCMLPLSMMYFFGVLMF